MKKEVSCDYCKKLYYKQICPSTKMNKHNFCSCNCKYKWQEINLTGEKNPFFGKIHSEKTKKQIGKLNSHPSKRKGIKQLQTVGDKNPAKRIDVRKKISERVKETHWDSSGKNNPMYGVRRYGKDNPAYIHGNSCRKYPFEFSKELKRNIFKRDSLICQKCGVYPNNDLTVHHIDYDKFNNKTINLITLCRICNLNVNKNRIYWKQFFKKRINEIYK